jgi:hypothetical protein
LPNSSSSLALAHSFMFAVQGCAFCSGAVLRLAPMVVAGRWLQPPAQPLAPGLLRFLGCGGRLPGQLGELSSRSARPNPAVRGRTHAGARDE